MCSVEWLKPQNKTNLTHFQWDINDYKPLIHVLWPLCHRILSSSQWFDISISQLTYLFIPFMVVLTLHLLTFSSCTLNVFYPPLKNKSQVAVICNLNITNLNSDDQISDFEFIIVYINSEFIVTWPRQGTYYQTTAYPLHVATTLRSCSDCDTSVQMRFKTTSQRQFQSVLQK